MLLRSRAEEFGQFIIDNNSTIRKTAVHFDISKSTVHNDINTKLKVENFDLYTRVKKILKQNFIEKHIRGGIATKNKYQKIRKR